MSGSVSRDIVRCWQEAVEAVERDRLEDARRLFWDIRHFSAKIWFNLSTVDLLLGDYAAADEKLEECLQKDAYLAVAYFQRGVIACLLGRLPQAQEMFAEAQKNVRSGDTIDYRQLGLALRLTRQQMEYNQAAVEAKLRAQNLASHAQMSVDELETLPSCVFRPARGLVDNLQKRNFLQSAKVVSSVPDIRAAVQEKKTLLVSSQSLSAPTSPASHRRLCVGAPSQQGAHLPPPSRPPPRLPPAAARRQATYNHHGNTDNSDLGNANRSGSQVTHQAENCDQTGVSVIHSNRYGQPNSSYLQSTGLPQRVASDSRSQPADFQRKGNNSLANWQPRAVATSDVNKGILLNSVSAVKVEGNQPMDMHTSRRMECTPVQVRKLSDRLEPAGAVAAMIRELNSGQSQGSNTSREEAEGDSDDEKLLHQGSVCTSQSVEVRGQRSGMAWPEAADRETRTKSEKPKPARPPPPRRLP